MSQVDLALADVIGLMVSFVLTLLVFSYTVGDNPLFKLTTHIFVGVAAGYATVVTISNIILPYLIDPLFGDSQEFKVLTVFYLLSSALLLTKISPQLSRLGNIPIAILVGIGAATAISGAVFGTISPQIAASISIFQTQENPIFAIFIIIGTLSTLIYFQFGVRKQKNKPSEVSQIIKWIGSIGQVFIVITFGTILAGVYFSALATFIERISFIWQFITDFFLTAFAA
jgi:hypothetical protein